MNYYTIVLFLPDRFSNEDTPPYYLAYVQTSTVSLAVELARDEAVKSYTEAGFYLTPDECRFLVAFDGYAPLVKE